MPAAETQLCPPGAESSGPAEWSADRSPPTRTVTRPRAALHHRWHTPAATYTPIVSPVIVSGRFHRFGEVVNCLSSSHAHVFRHILTTQTVHGEPIETVGAPDFGLRFGCLGFRW